VKYFKPISPAAQDLIEKLLAKDPAKRLGSKTGSREVLEHPFFSSIDFTALRAYQTIPQYLPPTQSQNSSVFSTDTYVKEEMNIMLNTPVTSKQTS
jgi:serine/threonine protein kinase